jgi:hypothetical protein
MFCALFTGLLLAGCGLFNMPDNDPPTHARIELTGDNSKSAQVVFSSTLIPLGDDIPVFLDADTVYSNLPISRQYEIDGPEFWIIVTRDDPGNDNMSMRVWAGDFLFVDDPVLPDTQQVVQVRYRFATSRY